jgi:RNA polymerase sigma factor for flagellar operon FliA
VGAVPTMTGMQKNLALNERNQLVLEQLPQVRYIAQKIHARLPHHIPLEDLVNTGVLGLIEALAKFDPKRNVQLQSYARYRIQGAILDSLREQDWSPRLLRQKERQLEAVREKLQARLGRPPYQAELAAGLGISDRQLQLLLRDLQGLEVTSLQEPVYLEGHSLDEKMADTMEESPFHLCQRAEMNSLLQQAMSKLSPRKRQVLDLYYFKGLTMKETGQRMGVCESRVSQIHSSAVASLKARMKEVLTSRQKGDAVNAHPTPSTRAARGHASVQSGLERRNEESTELSLNASGRPRRHRPGSHGAKPLRSAARVARRGEKAPRPLPSVQERKAFHALAAGRPA